MSPFPCHAMRTAVPYRLQSSPGAHAVVLQSTAQHASDAGEGQKVMSKVEEWLEHPDFLNVVDPDAGVHCQIRLLVDAHICLVLPTFSV